jgi:hypothetical protein
MLTQLLKEFLSFVKLGVSFPSSSQGPTTGKYYEPGESIPHSENLYMFDPFLYYPSGFFPLGFQIKIVYAFCIPIMSATFPIHLILLDLVGVVMSTDYGAPCFVPLQVLCVQERTPEFSYKYFHCFDVKTSY